MVKRNLPNVCQGECSSVRLDTYIFIGTSVLNCQTLKNSFSPNSSNIFQGTSVLNCQTLKTLFLQILVIKIIFFKKILWYTFCIFYLWAKYELIWSDITGQTVNLGANLLVMARTIPQNAPRVFFFYEELCLLKIFKCWIWLRFSRYGTFVILKYVKVPKPVKKF